MKEIGKLLELLNEYEGFSENEFESWRLDEYGLLTEGGDYMRIGTNAKIISKQFGFIKWLTESRKINRRKVNFQNIIYDYDEDLSDEEKLLMLLVIQDKPINFLISILK